jgi:hypothetical protein
MQEDADRETLIQESRAAYQNSDKPGKPMINIVSL